MAASRFNQALIGATATVAIAAVVPAAVLLGPSFDSSSRLWWAKAAALSFAGLLFAVPVLLLVLNRTWFPKIPEKVMKRRISVGLWITLPALCMALVWGAEPWRFLGTLHVMLAHPSEIVGNVTSAELIESRGSKSWRRYWEIEYSFSLNGTDFKGGYRARDERRISSPISVHYVVERPQSNVVADDPYVWRFFTERFLVASAPLLLGIWFFAFVAITWRQEQGPGGT